MNTRTTVGVLPGHGPQARWDGTREAGSKPPRSRWSAEVRRFLAGSFTLDTVPLSALAFLVGRSMVLQTLAPFGLALYAAVLALKPARGLATGLAVAAGIFSTGPLPTVVEFAGGAAGLSLLFLAFDKQSRTRSPLTLAALVFTVTVLAGSTKAFLVDPTPYRFLMAFFGGLLSFVLTLVYLSALPPLLDASSPVTLTPEQAVSLAVAAVTALAGLSGLGYAGARLSGAAVCFLTLSAAYCGGNGVGAAVGAVAGVVLSLCGAGGLSSVGLFALCGLLGGSFREFGKLGAAAGYFFGTLLVSPLVEEAMFLQATVLEAGAAALAFMLMPQRFLVLVRSALAGQGAASEPGVVEGFAREQVGKRLMDFSAVFTQLAATLRELSAASPAGAAGAPQKTAVGDGGQADSPTTGLADAACRVCQACRLFRTCWRDNLEATRAAMVSLLEVTAEKGQLEARDVPTQMRRRCVHLGELVTTMNFLHEISALNRHWRKRLDESRGVVSRQLEGLADILRELGEGLNTNATSDAAAAADLARHLERTGFDVAEVVPSGRPGGQTDLFVTAGVCETGNACRDTVLPLASALFRQSLVLTHVRCGLTAGLDECSFRLTVPRQLDFKMGVAQARKSSSGISGDSYLIRDLPGNRLTAILSDGTGAGPRAADESRSAVKTLEELFRLGFDSDMAVRTINSMLLLRSRQERFATLDLVTVDLNKCQARFIKVGAPPSYVKRGREVSVVHSANLPLGVIPEVSTEGHSLALRPGDMVVMATDGLISSTVGQAPGQSPDDSWVVGLLREMGEAGPQEVADALVEMAVALGGGRLRAAAGDHTVPTLPRGLRDDVTVLALRFGLPEET